ncbi:DUF3379 domain-containing protein [Alteromonas ponticola]|uniref:DUF3379 domain-containing protein n=1 Tax=Alteromonas aquimaris TaxID=2998417 RepID=A0ABT3P5H8_9ALTE|nr:DUF3379 family protein [Alteromonas aquimaris]MCW8107775.1 DUF3379 domain-containing protein [Alteromonas aquimaris]
MDELEFRRRVYADPQTTDEAVIAAAKADASKQAFWNDVKSLDKKLEKATHIAVPTDLAHRLIWQQSTKLYTRKKQKTRGLFAVAASIALVVGVSFTLWSQWLNADLQSQLLTHVAHVEEEISHAQKPADLTHINARLASFGGYLEQGIDEIEVANYCYLGAAKTLHLILKTAQGSLSVFVLPEHENRVLPDQFSNAQFKGSLLNLSNRNVVLVGGQNADLSWLEDKIEQRLKFSA